MHKNSSTTVFSARIKLFLTSPATLRLLKTLFYKNNDPKKFR